MSANKALIRFYARLIRKDQMKIDEVDPELREEVRKAMAEYEAAADKEPSKE